MAYLTSGPSVQVCQPCWGLGACRSLRPAPSAPHATPLPGPAAPPGQANMPPDRAVHMRRAMTPRNQAARSGGAIRPRDQGVRSGSGTRGALPDLDLGCSAFDPGSRGRSVQGSGVRSAASAARGRGQAAGASGVGRRCMGGSISRLPGVGALLPGAHRSIRALAKTARFCQTARARTIGRGDDRGGGALRGLEFSGPQESLPYRRWRRRGPRGHRPSPARGRRVSTHRSRGRHPTGSGQVRADHRPRTG